MRYLLLTIFALFIVGPLWLLLTRQASFSGDWRTANRESAKLAPDPAEFSEAIIQVYAARAFKWRGFFSVHTWIAAKEKNAKQYRVFQVVGWRLLQGLSTITMEDDIPDRLWFNSKPTILLDIRGIAAEKLIPTIKKAAEKYPHGKLYYLWPGPNSNSFVAFIARNVPELKLVIPGNAIGRDYLGHGIRFSTAPSGTGWQISFSGLLGLLVALKEGVEMNILGMVIGIGPADLSITLPAIGRLAVLKPTIRTQ